MTRQRAIEQLRGGALKTREWNVSPSDARALMREGIVREVRNYPGGSGSMYSYELTSKGHKS